MRDYDREIKQLQRAIFEDVKHASLRARLEEERDKHPDKKNVPGTMLSHIIYHVENEILQAVVGFLKTKNVQIMALIFDGMILRGTLQLGDDARLLDGINACIDREFPGMGMCMLYKAFDEEIAIPCDFDETSYKPATEPVDEAYAAWKDHFENELGWSKIINLACYMRYCKVTGKNLMMSENKLTTAHKHECRVDHAGKRASKPWIDKWISDPNMKTYLDVGVFPPPHVCPARHAEYVDALCF